MQGGGGSFLNRLSKAFTMAEILLSLTIIGVVAAITLPSLTGNINERTWNTQRKALYARFSQALALMPSLNGYGIVTEEQTDSAGSITQSAVDTAAETFITSGLSKVLKINNICDSEHLEDCGIPTKIIAVDGSIAFSEFPKNLFDYNSAVFKSALYPVPNTNVAAFETANGENVAVYYNPNCREGTHFASGYNCTQVQMCANFIYDLNGTKGPNTVGKDIGFITVLYPTDPLVVSPVPTNISAGWGFTYDNISSACKNVDSETRAPNIDELKSMVFNTPLVNLGTGWKWSSTKVDANNAYTMQMMGAIEPRGGGVANGTTRCIKR